MVLGLGMIVEGSWGGLQEGGDLKIQLSTGAMHGAARGG